MKYGPGHLPYIKWHAYIIISTYIAYLGKNSDKFQMPDRNFNQRYLIFSMSFITNQGIALILSRITSFGHIRAACQNCRTGHT